MLAAALTAVAVLWAAAIVAAPFAASHGRLVWMPVAAYQIGALICHQRPERSFHVAGTQMPVCARCFGLYAAGAAGVLIAWSIRRTWPPAVTRAVLVAGALPMALSVALEWAGAIATTNLFRMMTGVPLGLVAGVVMVSALRSHAR